MALLHAHDAEPVGSQTRGAAMPVDAAANWTSNAASRAKDIFMTRAMRQPAYAWMPPKLLDSARDNRLIWPH